MVMMLWERQLHSRFRFVRLLFVDSSPQFGHNFLCIREDRVSIPLAVTSVERSKFDINAHFETRVLPLSTLGLGQAGLVNKVLNVANIFLMETSSPEQFHKARREIRGMTTY